jgi:membrane protease YdiL (CAAX protease family)
VPWILVGALGPAGAWVATELGLGLRDGSCNGISLVILLLVAPLAEEIIFRMGVQNLLSIRLKQRIKYLSIANFLTAVSFGCLHAWHQHTPLIALTMLPSLAFGWTWEISAKRLRYPVMVHSWYNLCLVIPSCL